MTVPMSKVQIAEVDVIIVAELTVVYRRQYIAKRLADNQRGQS